MGLDRPADDAVRRNRRPAAEGAATPNAAAPEPRARRIRRLLADRLTYGIEIECCLPHGTLRIGEQVPGMPDGWKSKHDGSIAAPAGHQGVEIVSPILSGPEGQLSIIAACRWLKEGNYILDAPRLRPAKTAGKKS